MNNDTELLTTLEDALGKLTKEDYLEIMAEIDPVAWTERFRILKGEPFSFDERDYLLPIYRDEYKNLIIYKGRQVEMSEFSMNWLFRKFWKHPYTTGLHAFPRTNQAQKFSKQRLDVAISDSDLIKAWYDERNSEQVMRKFVRNDIDSKHKPYNFYILGGTWESRKDTVGDASRGTSLDFIVYDERQDHPNDVETVLGEGASHSKYKQTLTLGTPKLPGTQFDQQWESSDKRFWIIECPKCGQKYPITMDNILDSGDDEVGYYYGCPHCKNELNRQKGFWEPTNTQKRPPYRGYHINQLMVCWIDANEIMAKFNSPTYPRRRFYNEVLGFAYGGDDIPITMEMMMECCKNMESIGQNQGRIYIGIDWGAKSYMVMQNKLKNGGHRIVDVEIAGDSDPRLHASKFARTIKKYKGNISRIVCDAGPDIMRYHQLLTALKDCGLGVDVWPCYYAPPPAKTMIKWNKQPDNKPKREHYVMAGRSECIERIIDEISDGEFTIPGQSKDLDKIDDLIVHFTNIAAVRAKSQSGVEYIQYQNTGPDHFLHAKIYADVASSASIGDVNGVVVKPFTVKKQVEAIDRATKGFSDGARNYSDSSAIFKKRGRRQPRHALR